MKFGYKQGLTKITGDQLTGIIAPETQVFAKEEAILSIAPKNQEIMSDKTYIPNWSEEDSADMNEYIR